MSSTEKNEFKNKIYIRRIQMNVHYVEKFRFRFKETNAEMEIRFSCLNKVL